ncbi:MAG: hypothetical protein ABR570_07765 [Burkholderiales bacterium]
MKSFAAAAAAAVILGACAVSPPDNTFAYRPGTGVVQSVQPARVEIPGGNLPGSAASGGRVETPLSNLTKPRWVEGYQLTLRMDDGTSQAITQNSPDFLAGDRVQVTPEGRVLRAASGAQTPLAYRAGNGTVQAAAGGSAASSQEITVRMDDGTTQSLTVQGARFQTGERVAIGADGRVLKP